MNPWLRLGLVDLGFLWLIKAVAWFWEGRRAGLAYFLWPGISSAGFERRAAEPPAGTGARFREAWGFFLGGVAVLVAVSLWGRGEVTWLNYVALFAMFAILHLGLVEILADALRLLGYSPASLFDRPYLADSLRDFWSHRWNRAFVDMNKIFLHRPLRGRVPALAFVIFLVSGVLHELGISFPAGGGWGGPFAYFVIQGAGFAIERRVRFPRALVWLWLLAPAPLLFQPVFVNLFLGGFSRLIAGAILGMPIVRTGWLLGGTLHFLVLAASVQVPGKLGWREEFQKLRPLNRKVFWTYGAYIFSIILFMAGVSFTLASQPVSVAAFLWGVFIALFWWARVLTDFFYMSHADWPRGPLFEIGHVCLTTVFVSLALLYSGLAVWLVPR